MRIFIFIIVSLFSSLSFAVSNNDKILASIRPLQSIVANITEGVDDVGLIVEDGVSLHSYAMKPADAKKINQAELVILIDRNMETFLDNSVIRNKKINYIEVARLPNVKLLSTNSEGCSHHHHEEEEHENHHHEHEKINSKEHEHEHSQVYNDYHVWFDINNVKNIAVGLTAYFKERSPENSIKYQANLEKFITKLDELNSEISLSIANNNQYANNYIVSHNAYQYYIKSYNLKEPLSITIDHGTNIGARDFIKIKSQIKNNKISCIIEEPNYPSAVIEKLKEDSKLRVYYYDPEIGSDKKIDKAQDHYFNMMCELKNIFQGCLQ